MKEEQVIFSLIKRDCETNGSTNESKLVKMATLLNIHPDIYQKALERLIESRQIGKHGRCFFLV
jgi:hypothetical protein